MNSESINLVNVIKYAGAFVACAIGSGFATGQEILQFFSGQGIMGIAGTVVTTVIFAWVGGMFMKHGQQLQLEHPEGIIRFYFGQKIGIVFQVLFQIFMFGVYVIMIAGAGATLHEYFGLDPMIGRVGMATLAFITVIFGLSKITDVLGGLGTVIIVFSVGVGIYSFASNMGGMADAAALIPTLTITKTAGGWLWSSILYPGFNAMIVLILTTSMGKTASNPKEAMYGGVAGGMLFGISVLAMNLGLMANIGDVYSKAVPTLVLANKISPIFALIFSVIICCGIYTTTVPMLWSVVRSFAEDGTKKAVLLSAGLTIAGLILGMTGFKTLVNLIYPISGYMGIALMIFVGYREYGKTKIQSRAKSYTNSGLSVLEQTASDIATDLNAEPDLKIVKPGEKRKAI